ncbi:hypothetical protein BGZ75_003141, partial [Mortierella antarctica]
RLRVVRIWGSNADIWSLVEGQNRWICSELEELVMSVGMDRLQSDLHVEQDDPKAEAEAEMKFMSRLGELTKLRGVRLRDDKGVQLMSWQLTRGLAHLAGLTQLRKLDLGRVASERFQQGIPELEFMKEHWPHLNTLARPPLVYAPELVQWLKENWPQLT